MIRYRILALLAGCAAVAIESISGSGPVDATGFLTIAAVIALP
jgi:hypothetical protein